MKRSKKLEALQAAQPHGTPPSSPPVPAPGFYWIRTRRCGFYWANRHGLRIKNPPQHLNIWAVYDWRVTQEEFVLPLTFDWSIVEVGADGNFAVFGGDGCYAPWRSDHEVVTHVSPRIEPPVWFALP